MRITKEAFNKFAEPSEEIILKLEEKCRAINRTEDRNYVELGKLDFELNGFGYSLNEFDTEPIEDDGKYQYGGMTYQLVEFDMSIANYPNQHSMTRELNLFVYVWFSRSGSYYSDYYYTYGSPIVKKIEQRHVERVVIEAHDEYGFVGTEEK